MDSEIKAAKSKVLSHAMEGYRNSPLAISGYAHGEYVLERRLKRLHGWRLLNPFAFAKRRWMERSLRETRSRLDQCDPEEVEKARKEVRDFFSTEPKEVKFGRFLPKWTTE